MNAGRCDVAILGGGPAGSAAARLLAGWGHHVRVITRPPGSAVALPESLPPSCRKLFGVLGVQEAVEAAGFVRSRGNTVWWGDDEGRVEPFAAGEYGWQVTSDALERVLLAAAATAGARIERRRLTEDSARHVSAQWILDCTGRAGLLARAGAGRRHEPDLRTVALAGLWRRRDAWPLPDETHTVIESYGNGWAWSVPAGDGRRYVAVMVDPRTSRLLRGAPSLEVYRAELAKTRRFAALLGPAVLDGGPWGWDASMYCSTRYVSDHVLFVGDAGSFLDPLSSAGVKKALASGWLAAIVAHTCLTRPPMREVALEFFAAREAAIYAGLSRLTRRFLADAALSHSAPFWSDRAGPLDIDVPAFDVDDLRRDPAVASAFAWVRQAPAIALLRGPSVRIAERPTVRGHEVTLEPRLVADDLPEGVRFLRDVDLVRLLDLAPRFSQVPDLFEAYGRLHAPVALADFLGALATAIARGWLVSGPGESGPPTSR